MSVLFGMMAVLFWRPGPPALGGLGRADELRGARRGDPGAGGEGAGGPGRAAGRERRRARLPRRSAGCLPRRGPWRGKPARALARGRPARRAVRVWPACPAGPERPRGTRPTRPGAASSSSPVAGRLRAFCPGPARGRHRTRPSMRWPRCACARSWSGSPTMPRRGGCWVTSATTAAGPGRSPSDSSRKGTSIIPSTAGCPRTGWPTSRPASFPRPWPGARRSPMAPRPRGRRAAVATGRIPGRSPPSTSRSAAMCRSPRPSSSPAGSRRFTTSSSRSWPTWWARTCRWPGGSARPRSTGEASYRPHQVDYFASKDEYVEHLASSVGAGHRPEPGLLQPSPAGQGQPRPGPLLPRSRRPASRHGHPLSRGVAPASLRDRRPQRLHQERGELLGLRGAGDLLRDGDAPAGRLARGRRPGRRADRGGPAVASPPAGSSRSTSSSGSTRTRSTAPTGSTTITSRPWR